MGFNLKVSEKQATIGRYEERLKNFGYDLRTLGWRTKRQQYIRFKNLIQIGNLNNTSVLDLGCGFGDLYDFLSEQNIQVEYTGYDISPKIIEVAIEMHPNLNFEVKDILIDKIDNKFDYILESGIFNWKLTNNYAFVKKMIKKCFDLCNIGLAFDMMSSYVDFYDEKLFYYDPVKIFKFCKKLSKRIVLKHDYMPYEFIIYIYKIDEIDNENVFKVWKKNNYI